MKKIIQFIMRSAFIGQGIQEAFEKKPNYETALTDDYRYSECFLESAVGRGPDIALIEVPDHPNYSLEVCLSLCRGFREKYPGCKLMLFITYTYMDDILPEVAEQKRMGLIDSFVTGQMRRQDIVAQLQALA